MSEQGVIILIEESDRSKAGGEEEGCHKWAGWMKGVCVFVRVCVCVWYLCMCACVVGRVGFPELLRHDRAITRPGGDAMWIIPCCAVKHKQLCCEAFIFCASEKSLSVGRKWKGCAGGREKKKRYRERRYHGGVIKEAKSGEEKLRRYHWHLGSLWFLHFTSLWTANSPWQ